MALKANNEVTVKQAAILTQDVQALKKPLRIRVKNLRGCYGPLYFDDDCEATVTRGNEKYIDELKKLYGPEVVEEL